MRGRILFNGNIARGLAERIRPWLMEAATGRAPRVLLVTAAWGPNEYNEGAVKASLNQVGVPSRFVGGYDRNIQNLCAWHAWRDFLARRRDVAAVYQEVEAASEDVRGFYLERTAFNAALIRRGVAMARDRVPGFALGRVHGRDPVRPEAAIGGAELVARALGRELGSSIAALVDNDQRMMQSLREGEEQLLSRAGLRTDPEWRRVRARLENRILGADVILLLGGSPTRLLAPFRFFDLRPALMEALRRGSTLVGTSAGALVLCERMIVYNDRSPDPSNRDFRLLDRGLGLVGGMQILPHCMDRIQTDDPDNLAYLARRFSTRICAGLNQESFLLLEMDGPTATSVGRGDGVYVFGADGVKTCYRQGETIPLG